MKRELEKRYCLKCSHYSWGGAYNDGEHWAGGCINSDSPTFRKTLDQVKDEQIENCRFFNKNKDYKTVIITGASKGIGKAIADRFASLTPCVDIALVSRHYDGVAKIVKEIEEKHTAYSYQRIFLPFECDIKNEDRVNKTFEEIYKQFGSIDVLVNNAGVNMRRKIDEMEMGDWHYEIETNLTGTLNCSRAAIKYMKEQKNSSIVNIASIKGKEACSSVGYGASKAGIIEMTRCFAKQFAPYNIRVNCVAPGFIDTGMTKLLSDEELEKYLKLIPLGRLGKSEEVAKVVAFLASDDASYITGTTIDVNGGYLMS